MSTASVNSWEVRLHQVAAILFFIAAIVILFNKDYLTSSAMLVSSGLAFRVASLLKRLQS